MLVQRRQQSQVQRKTVYSVQHDKDRMKKLSMMRKRPGQMSPGEGLAGHMNRIETRETSR